MAEIQISEERKMLAHMAHDIKAPLATIIDLLDVINKGYVDEPDKIKELVSRASQKAESLALMLDDILDYTLLEDKTMMKRETVNILEILNESINIMKIYARERKISLILHKDLLGQKNANGNYTFLLRVFNNLIMNAIKYNKENGEVSIDYTEDMKNNSLTMAIADTGIGIAPEEQEKIFKLFERGKNARKNINGSLGLGLSLVKQIIEDHDGEIKLTSTVGVGTIIYITLPLLKKEE
ncbi:MAG: HAMP domain-containing histidine kinase [Acidobacteria bacterium]|jgi:two-component system phosphate regulon sensor histidine kinase PhoR|nr:HAMP domain-containing histidine kinase [Acidobacteriota bacterium]